MMNKIQAKELYEKMFANYPDVLTVEDATKLLGFKSQTAVIRRVHQHRIRCLKVGRSFMIGQAKFGVCEKLFGRIVKINIPES